MNFERRCVIGLVLTAALAACTPYPAFAPDPSGRAPVVPGQTGVQQQAAARHSFRLKAEVPADIVAVYLTVTAEALIDPVVIRIDAADLASAGFRGGLGPLPTGAFRVAAAAVDAGCVVRFVGEATGYAGPNAAPVALGWSPAPPDAVAPAGCAGPSPSPSPEPSAPPAPLGDVTGAVALGASPWGVAVDGAGQIWVANAGDGTVTRIAPDGQVRGVHWVGAQPRGVAVDAAGVAWVALAGADAVVRLGPGGEVRGRTNVGQEPWDVAIDGTGRAWVTNRKHKTVSVVAPDGHALATHRVEKEPEGLAAASNGQVWVTSAKRDRVMRLAADGALLGETEVAGGPTDLAFAADGHAWVATSAGRAYELAPDGRVLGEHAIGAGATAVAVDPAGRPWFACADEGSVHVRTTGGWQAFLADVRPVGVAFGAAADAWIVENGTERLLRVAR